METLQIPDEVKEILHYAEGKTLEEKLARLVVSDVENRLRSCAERLCEFEKKYGIAFEQFKKEKESPSSAMNGRNESIPLVDLCRADPHHRGPCL